MYPVNCLAQFYYHQLQNNPRKDAFAQKVDGIWEKTSISDFIKKAQCLSAGLLKLGVEKGDRVAVVSNNRTEWHLLDLAVQQIGGINVPIYTNITPEEYDYILNDCGAKLVFVSDDEIFQKIDEIKSNVSSLQGVYSFDKLNKCDHYSALLSEGDFNVDNYLLKINIKETATLIYTSGTTGKPKGVMLSHENLISNVMASEPRFPMVDDMKSLSFLPLCHVFERMLDYVYIYKSVSIYYAESMETIGDNLKEIKPHIFATVPRLLEKVYDKIVAKGSDLSGIKKKLFFWALELGLKFEPGKQMGGFYNFQLSLANKIIFSKWREALGGNILAIPSGGAALQPRLARVFSSAQIPILEGYGLTETSPVIAVNSLGKGETMVGTVGRPLENLEVKIAQDGEILVKGPSIMQGYYNKQDLTDEVINKEGYFHTGDIGEFVDDKFLKITDRKKEMFKTSGGKYIAPQVMENKFKESRFIEQIIVIGEGQKHASAIIQPDFVFLKDWAARKGHKVGNSLEDLVASAEVIDRIKKEVLELNSSFANYEQVKKFELVNNPWSVETGELTPTLKLKRKFILEKYNSLIVKIYGNI